ncbi:MAG TPA: 16S rRNA (cytidine(1402)-2'-O)-methyltransferase [Spirochaetota bacterium]|nr:16S rRNA (cytidine(1402)-2'-O)-methyltransferase [Spirochaetota bacterium]
MPIGNLQDISLRALELLEKAQLIIVEDYKTGKKMLDLLKIALGTKDIIELNEHNEQKEAGKIAESIILKYQKAALISDAGHPVVADPGLRLVQELIQFKVKINYIPGASSVIGALITAGLPVNHFHYSGFLPRQSKERENRLRHLKSIKSTLIIMETPYRLPALIKSIKKIFYYRKPVVICFELTTPQEYIFRGTLQEAAKKFMHKKCKNNFVFLIDNNIKKKK